MKILTVLGARPQFVKAAVVSRALKNVGVEETLVHTGQHYDVKMSDVFFEELGLPAPGFHLGIGGLSHGAMTGRMLESIEKILLEQRPDWVLVYGDTNSTLAGALAASKLHIPVAHVEAGMRSFNRCMPEEINRVMTDHLSQLLLCTSQNPVDLLAQEGIVQGVHLVGDVMYDAVKRFKSAAIKTGQRKALGLKPQEYILLTLHRQENTVDLKRLQNFFQGLLQQTDKQQIVFPIHPRTRKIWSQLELLDSQQRLRLIEPLSYFHMLDVLQGAKLVITDSGGLQKEALYLNKPCITLRNETEWVETVTCGWNFLVGLDSQKLSRALSHFAQTDLGEPPVLYGEGNAAEKISELITRVSA